MATAAFCRLTREAALETRPTRQGLPRHALALQAGAPFSPAPSLAYPQAANGGGSVLQANQSAGLSCPSQVRVGRATARLGNNLTWHLWASPDPSHHGHAPAEGHRGQVQLVVRVRPLLPPTVLRPPRQGRQLRQAVQPGPAVGLLLRRVLLWRERGRLPQGVLHAARHLPQRQRECHRPPLPHAPGPSRGPAAQIKPLHACRSRTAGAACKAVVAQCSRPTKLSVTTVAVVGGSMTRPSGA